MVSRAMLEGVGELGLWALRRRRRYRVAGKSMEPTLVDGDVVLVDPGGPVRAGELVVAAHPDGSGMQIVKRVERLLGDGRVVLSSDNPAAGTDSRRWGPLPPTSVQGRVTVVLDRPLRGRPGSPGRRGTGR